MKERDNLNSLPNAIMIDVDRASETIPNLDAKFSFLPYKLCGDGMAPDKVQLFSCMSFVHDSVIHKDVPVLFYDGQMTKDDIK
jgi:hypothetical protein